MADLFISYSRSDRPRCSEIGDALAALKVDVWFDVGIEPGHSFDREIERELGAAKAVLVLWSEASVGSDWVRNEARPGKESDRLALCRSRRASCRSNSARSRPALAGRPAGGGEPGLAGGAAPARRPDRAAGAFGLCAAGGGDGHAARRLAPLDRGQPRRPARRRRARADDRGRRAGPQGQLASERARRAALEAELADHVETDRAQAGEVANAGRELRPCPARARRGRSGARRRRGGARRLARNLAAGPRRQLADQRQCRRGHRARPAPRHLCLRPAHGCWPCGSCRARSAGFPTPGAASATSSG